MSQKFLSCHNFQEIWVFFSKMGLLGFFEKMPFFKVKLHENDEFLRKNTHNIFLGNRLSFYMKMPIFQFKPFLSTFGPCEGQQGQSIPRGTRFLECYSKNWIFCRMCRKKIRGFCLKNRWNGIFNKKNHVFFTAHAVK